jgi:hypothetical protein
MERILVKVLQRLMTHDIQRKVLAKLGHPLIGRVKYEEQVPKRVRLRRLLQRLQLNLRKLLAKEMKL